MNKLHICPKCGGTKFTTTAHVMQEWVVDETGNFQEEAESCIQIDAGPDDDNDWICTNCGETAVIVTPEEAEKIKKKFASKDAGTATIYGFEIIREDRDCDGDKSSIASEIFLSKDREVAFKKAKIRFQAILATDPEFKKLKNNELTDYEKEYERYASQQGYEGNYITETDAMLFNGHSNGEAYYTQLFIRERKCKACD